MSFDQFGLSKNITQALEEKGYTTPTEIQAKIIPLVLEGRDVLGGAQTGTGKTASFMLPILHMLQSAPAQEKRKNPRALILAPTRELAAQVYESAYTYGKHLDLKPAVVFGGVPIRSQVIKMRRGIDILVATPGRLLDHIRQRTVDLSEIEYLVLDEADCMLDMGFIHDIKSIMSSLPKKRQTLFFSATFEKPIRALAEGMLVNPETVQVAKRNTTSAQVKQTLYRVDRDRKGEMIYDLLTGNDWPQVLVFTRTKHCANRLCEKLNKDDIHADAIHGNKSQAARSKALKGFKSGHTRVLVATDVATRGINIEQLPCVINYELPEVSTDYVHRIGRTGRAGNTGEAISLVCVDELRLLADIEHLIQSSIEQKTLEGYVVNESIKPQPIRKGRGFGRPAPQGNRRPSSQGSRFRRSSRPSQDEGSSDRPNRSNRKGPKFRRAGRSSAEGSDSDGQSSQGPKFGRAGRSFSRNGSSEGRSSQGSKPRGAGRFSSKSDSSDGYKSQGSKFGRPASKGGKSDGYKSKGSKSNNRSGKRPFGDGKPKGSFNKKRKSNAAK